MQDLINLRLSSCSCLDNSDLVLELLHCFTTSSMHSYICIVAPHLGTLDVQRMDVKHTVIGAEPQDGVRWTSPENGRTR